MQSTRRGSFSVHRSEKTPGSKYSSTSGLSPRGHLERQAEFHRATPPPPLARWVAGPRPAHKSMVDKTLLQFTFVKKISLDMSYCKLHYCVHVEHLCTNYR